jgi:hypothetical protein
MSRLQQALDFLGRAKEGAKKEFEYGKEDHRMVMRRAREEAQLEQDGPMFNDMLGSNRTATLLNELIGRADPAYTQARQKAGMGLSSDPATRLGQIGGVLASDIVQDRGRSIWWLLNAPQATTQVIQDAALKNQAPELWRSKAVADAKGNQVKSKRLAAKMGIADTSGKPKVGYSRSESGYQERLHGPGSVAALQIPAGIAINSAVGLLNPFGGQEGYKAVLESEEDPSKTSNVLGEVAAKYVLGKTGNLLPWDEFKQVRPDVSKGEYMRYKAFKFDKEGDLNPLDGTLTAPTGVVKYTNEGIHGPEVQFLGRSIPVATGILPTAAAIAGTALGARGGRPGRGLGVGLASMAGGQVLGNAIENERRRRNQEENERGYNS